MKILSGIVVVLLALLVGAAFVGYNMFLAPAVSMVGDATRFTLQYQSLNEHVRNVRPYSPPSGTDLTQDQLRRMLAAQGDVKDALAGRLNQLESKYQEIERSLQGRELDLREMFGAYRDVIDLLLLAKRSQVEALNRHDFSLQEYAWVQQQAYMALGQQVSIASLDAIGAPRPQAYVSDQVLAIVEPYREQLMELYPLAWFGL